MADKAQRRYRSLHWGINPTRRINVADPDLPDDLVAMGRLVELQVTTPEGEELTIAPNDGLPLIAIDINHPDDRLYLTPLSRRVRAAVRRRWAEDPDAEWWDLAAVAQRAGGRHAADDYPEIAVTPIGTLDAVVYLTSKDKFEPHSRPDGLSEYIHQHGEINGIKPILCADRLGRLWYAGGDYDVPRAGIRN